MIKIAIIQLEFCETSSKDDRITKVDKLLNRCSGADLILLPELWNFGWHSLFDKEAASIKKVREYSESIKGKTVSFISEKAREINSYIVAGSILENRNDSFFNTAVFLNPKGEIISTYSKMHLANYLGYQEANLLTPGNGISTIKTELGVLGFSICYDLRFPELYRKMAVKHNVEIFILISAFAMERLQNWHNLCHARANENQCFLVACDAVGIDRGHKYLGYSSIINPKGINMACGGSSECIIKGEIDIRDIYNYRKAMPNLKNIVFSI